MSTEFQRELSRRLQDGLRRRDQLVRAGLWGPREEEAFNEARLGVISDVRAQLLRSAVIEDLVLSSGFRPDETILELRLEAAAKRAGGFEKLALQQGRNLGELREELRRADIERRFWRSFVPAPPEPTPAQIREYYMARREQMRSAPLVKLRVIQLPAGEHELADELRRELQYAPDRFAQRAREHSAHRESAERGGLLAAGDGFIPLDSLPGPLAAAVARMNSGEVSNLIELADLIYLLKLEDARPGRAYTLEEVSEQIAELLRRAAEERALADWCEYYFHRVYVSLTPASADVPQAGGGG